MRLVMKRTGSLITITILLLSGLFASVQPSYAATVKTIPSTSTIVAKANKLKLTKNNYNITWNIANHKVKTGVNSEKILCIQIKKKNEAWTVTDFCKIKFLNAGVIDGRQIDCIVNFDSMTVTARKASSAGETSDGYMGFASIWGIDDGLQVGVTIEDGCGYRAKKTIKYTATIIYHDTGETVNLPFFQAVRDLDAMNDYYREAWASTSGYTGVYYKYSTNYNTFDGNKVLAPNSKDKLVSGNNELLKAGIYAPTTGGRFSATFYEGNSGTLMTLYSQYSTNPKVFIDPSKSVDKSKAKVGDSITYTVKHTMGTFYKTTMTVYGRLEIVDVLPKEVTYQSAKLTNGKGNDITSSGTLTYNSSTRTVKFVMGDSWRKNTANYNGQVLKLTIVTEANDFDGTLVTAKNTADLSYETNLTVITNRVTTDIEKDAPVNPPVNPDPPVKPDPPVIPPVTPDPPVDPPYVPEEPPKPTTLKLQLVKRIPNDANQLGYGHGNPTFIFKITGQNSGKVWYRSVTYGVSSVSSGWSFVNENGYKVAYGPVETFPIDTYSVSEINVSRFIQKQSGRSESGDKTTFTFTNEKDNWQYFSHKSVVINTEKGGAADVWK